MTEVRSLEAAALRSTHASAQARAQRVSRLLRWAQAQPGATQSFEQMLAGWTVDRGPSTVDRALTAPRDQRSTLHAPRSTLHGPRSTFDDLIGETARRHGVDEGLVRAVVQVESGFNPGAVSPAGAKGLMQLMDGTAGSLGVRDSFDPVQNLDGGVRYLRSMLERFGSLPLALAAYNAGPGAVQRFGGIPPYAETQAYVTRVMNAWNA